MSQFIPHIDLWPANQPLANGFFSELKNLYRKGAFSGGEYVENFEKEFGSYLGSDHCIGVNSGTSALHLALLALGIGPGDEVIVPAYTFAGTAWGILYCGAKPVFVDVELETGNLSISAVEKALTSRTRAIIVVHLFGQTAKMDELQAIARKRKIPIIEDAAQAHGARIAGKTLGTQGLLGCFSFYPTKNLGACGEGGAVVTDNKRLAEKIRLLRNHNAAKRYEHLGLGFNYRLEGIQGLFLSRKLEQLDKLNQERLTLAKVYLKTILDSRMQSLCAKAELSVWHAFVCRVPNRKLFVAHLEAAGIGSAHYYPKILPALPPFRAYLKKGATFPNALTLSRTTVSLPLYPGLPKASLKRIVSALEAWR